MTKKLDWPNIQKNYSSRNDRFGQNRQTDNNVQNGQNGKNGKNGRIGQIGKTDRMFKKPVMAGMSKKADMAGTTKLVKKPKKTGVAITAK